MTCVILIVMRMITSDENLAKAAAEGDRDAFGTLLERCYDDLFGLAFRLMGSRSEAEDLTQDICAALPAKLCAYRQDAKFTTWLYRVAVNAAHDRRRRAVSHAKAASGWGNWELNRVAENALAQTESDWLASAMSQLSDDLRDTLALLLDGELSHSEAANVLDISEGTVSWRMSEAKKHLREIAAKEAGQ